MSRFRSWAEIALTFLRLGAVGFGGPAATIAMMEEQCVERKRWLPREQFLDVLGMTNLIPGPNAVEIAIHVGLLRGGWLGFLLAGIGFIFPAALISLALAWAYVHSGAIFDLEPLLFGIRPAVLAVMAVAVWRLGKTAVKSVALLMVGMLVVLLSLLGIDEIAAMFLGAIVGAVWLRMPKRKTPHAPSLVLVAEVRAAGGHTGAAFAKTATIAGISATAASVPLWQIGLFFLKVGAVLYGTGYVLIALLEDGLVRQYGWLTREQLLDAVAVGQFTPGPFLSTATFIGYLLAGTCGAIVATVAVFLPSFAYVAALHRVLPQLRRSPWAAAFLDAVNTSAIALMALVAVNLAARSLTTRTAWFVFLPAALLHLRWRVSAAWLVLGGAAAGWLLLGAC